MTSKEIWDKIIQSYEGDSQEKRAKLQSLRVQYETLKMHSDENIASSFLHVDEIVNCMKNMGEEIKEATLVEKILISLSSKSDSKVFVIEENQDLQSIIMVQHHGILIAFEMRKGGPSDMREAYFKASTKRKEKEAHNESGYISKEEDEENFVKKLQRGSGKFRGENFGQHFKRGKHHQITRYVEREFQPERCGIAFFAEGQENYWYIDSEFSKLVRGDKERLRSYNFLQKEKNVSFGNDTPVVIKGKDYVYLKEKVKAGNVMYVDGLNHNLLSVNQICDQRNEVLFRPNGYVARELNTQQIVIKGTRTPNNLYILKGGQKQCYLSKTYENWLWHRILGHLSFSQIRKACRLKVVHNLPDIRIPENTICKPCQVGMKTIVHSTEKEG
eukprot:PITA_09071